MNALIQRLISARKAAGISQAVAAERLSISRPTFIAIEKGTRDVKPEELMTLAKLYNTSLNRLMRQNAPPTQVAPHLRAVVEREGEDAGLDCAIAKLTEFVDDYMFLLDKVQGHAMPTPPPQPARSPLPVERFAERQAIEQRHRLGFGDREPIGSLRKTLDEIGVHVFIDGLDSKLAGLYAYIENFGYCILVNRRHPQARRRWTIAHEYGHFLFDRDRRGVDYAEPMQRKPENERFADAFAMHFLMPSEGVQRRFHDTYQQKGDVSVGDVLRIADYYGVSLMAMVLRLESLGLIRRNSWDAIKASGAKVRDIRAESGIEEIGDQDSVEIFPDRYLMLAIEAWSSEKITTSQFAKLMRKSIVEAREFAYTRSQQEDDNQSIIEFSLGDSLLHREQPTA
ncbi:XRE family transcriptional regulator [Aerolutibacter ruishenii]|uniref:Zn-dependent peptidase ImmA (M78 family) n=1 Tax=Aerolutibacter ruishenii TaxID=686800 RepID=A0A562LP33_9GAMM|nr:XRE family transcriptional regulator [Lysobacter ruishenii]TWI09399.1 Zn-dependent peptidase ImmA (M78 family) [Lysobacter ruishenii]